VIAHDLLPLLEKEARKRQTLAQKCAKVAPNGKGKASQIAARMAKTNGTYVELVKSIGKAAPELLDKIRSGVLKVPEAAKLAKLPDTERKELLKRCNCQPLNSGDLHELLNEVRKARRQKAAVSFARRIPADQDILIGDMDMLWKRLKDDSVHLFLTDPPYADVSAYERLAELAAAKLKPGRLCLAYSGQIYLPEVMAAMGRHLKYWWTFAIRFSGSHCAIHPRRIQNTWKPILAFCKPPLKPSSEWLSDMLQGGGRDKQHHDWGQDQSEVEYVIEKLTEAGQLVVDPFCGGGQIPAACKALGRRWIATEIDRGTALIARKRLAEMSRSKKNAGKAG
jgi:hypothetical protein